MRNHKILEILHMKRQQMLFAPFNTLKDTKPFVNSILIVIIMNIINLGKSRIRSRNNHHSKY